ncbi:MAG: HD-GYP domain-containing protein [Acidaminococcales bacterium]|jgi:putative nucleotidyltransferase with HDIG domain|nr:HD-GYP domain-containing protein [Acidaminococcales bacterium]
MGIKRVTVDSLKVGMMLAEPIVIRNNIIQNSEEPLSADALRQVRDYGKLFSLSILFPDNDKQSDVSAKDDDISDFSFGKRNIEDYTTEEKKVVIEKYVGTVSYVKNVFDIANQFNTISLDDVMSMAKSTVDGLLDNYSLVHVMKNLRGRDDYTYQHSVNVGVLAGIIGRWLKMDEIQIDTLVLAGMMHDIGKAKIPKEIVNKPGKLDAAEFELMKQHTVEGYKILTNVDGIPEDVRLSALQHHERIDGSGYPLGLKAESIRDFSKIIAVADTYDAVTTDRVYQPKRPPLAVMEILDDEMFKKMDARSCLSMLVQIRDSLQGKRVVLKNGESGTIVFVGKHGTDDLVVRTDKGRSINIGKSNYHKEISKYLG